MTGQPFFEEPDGSHKGQEAEESPVDLDKPGDGRHK